MTFDSRKWRAQRDFLFRIAAVEIGNKYLLNTSDELAFCLFTYCWLFLHNQPEMVHQDLYRYLRFVGPSSIGSSDISFSLVFKLQHLFWEPFFIRLSDMLCTSVIEFLITYETPSVTKHWPSNVTISFFSCLLMKDRQILWGISSVVFKDLLCISFSKSVFLIRISSVPV